MSALAIWCSLASNSIVRDISFSQLGAVRRVSLLFLIPISYLYAALMSAVVHPRQTAHPLRRRSSLRASSTTPTRPQRIVCIRTERGWRDQLPSCTTMETSDALAAISVASHRPEMASKASLDQADSITLQTPIFHELATWPDFRYSDYGDHLEMTVCWRDPTSLLNTFRRSATRDPEL